MVVFIHVLDTRADAGSVRSFGLLGFGVTPRNLLMQLLVTVSNGNSEVSHHRPALVLLGKVCRDSGNNPVCFAWASGNSGVRNCVIKKDSHCPSHRKQRQGLRE